MAFREYPNDGPVAGSTEDRWFKRILIVAVVIATIAFVIGAC